MRIKGNLVRELREKRSYVLWEKRIERVSKERKTIARISKTKHKLLGERGKNQEPRGRLLGRVEFCSFVHLIR